MKIAIPHHGGEVAPCFEYSAHITIFTVRGSRVVGRMDFALKSKEELDRFRLLRDQGVSHLICGGIQSAFEDLLQAGGIEVISWVEGKVDDLLGLFLKRPADLRPSRPGTKASFIAT